jgi:dihydrolipoamide dehydrogenase
MVVGEIAEPVDLLVVGAGPGGYVAAVRAAQLGRSVTVVDREGGEGGPGGSCLHVGCIPSKALIELGDAVHRTRSMAVAGLRIAGDVRVDLEAFQAWKASIVEHLDGGVRGLFRRHGIDYVAGDLRFTRPDRAAVLLADGGSRFLEFRQAIVATGSRPAQLPALPVDGRRVVTSTGALALTDVPATVAVVGGGYIGLEIGTALSKLGARVTVVEALDRLLPSIDAALAKPVLAGQKRHGIAVRLGCSATGLDGEQLVVADADGEQRVPADLVVVAVGRRPNTDDLGLELAGIDVDERGLVPVDSRRMATSNIAAIGDVTAGPALAHKASAEAIVAAEALSGHAVAFEPFGIPAIVFTDPEVATVGLTEEQARAEGMDPVMLTSPLRANGRAATMQAADGFTRVVVDRATDRVVGVHIVGPHASELIAEGTLAVEMIAAPDDLLGTIHPHPTLSEGLHAALEQLTDREPVAAAR